MQATSGDERDGPALEGIDSEAGKLVYLYLDTVGAATVEELTSALDLAQIRLYPILQSLSERDLVARRDGAYRTAN